MDKGHRRRMHILVVCIFCFVLLVIHAFGRFQKTFFDMELKSKQKELEQTAKVKVQSIQKKYANMEKSLEALAENAKDFSAMDLDAIISQLQLLAKVGYFDYVGISDKEGNFIDSQSQTNNIKERDYFQDAMKGNTTISDVMNSNVRQGEEIQVIALPIVSDEPISRGIVFGILNIDRMDQLLENETESEIYIQIVDSQGNYMTRSKSKDVLIQNKNVWDDLKEYEFLEGSLEEIKEDMAYDRNGNFVFRINGEERVSFYMPLSLKGYYIFSTIDSRHIMEWAIEINEEVFIMVLEMGMAFLVLVLALYLYNKNVQEELKKSHAEAVSSEEMMGIVIQESQQIVFEYDLHTGTFKKKAGVENNLFPAVCIEKVPESILEKNMIAEISVPVFREMFEKIRKEELVEGIIKTNAENRVHWYQIIMKNIYGEKHELLNTVGIVEDVTKKKIQEELLEEGEREKQDLQERAERDGLTGLYNAATVKMKVQEALRNTGEKSGPHFFILMDLDNFKEINDTFGHQYGDRVLKEVADTLRKTFRKDDILGRLGGDEFVAMLLNASSFEVMEPVFDKLCRGLKKTYTKDGKSVTVSASLGIAEAPEQGTTFRELYGKSDMTLYRVKKETKNGYKLYGSQ